MGMVPSRLLRSSSSVVAFVAAAAAGAACSLASLSDLSSGDDDGGARAKDAGAPDAAEGRDAGAPDDGGSTDAPADAPPNATFCATITPKPLFCDDFERPDPKGTWGDPSLSGGGALATVPSTRGAGRELLATIPVFGAGGVSSARMERTFPETDEVSVSYALRVDAAPGQGGQQIMNVVVYLPANGDFFSTYVFVRPEDITLVEQTFPGGNGGAGVFVLHPLAETIPFGEWKRLELVIKLSAPPRLKLSVGGKVAFDGPADGFYRRGAPTLTAGVHYTNAPSGPLSVRVDDLTVDVK